MTPKMRSITGAVLALLVIPVVFGLMACLPMPMPMPIGDPERSRIDHDMSGAYADCTDAGNLFAGETRRLMRVEGRDIEVVAEFLEDLIDYDPR